MKYIMAQYKVKSGRQAEVWPLVRDFVAAVTANEPGTLYYDAYVQKDNVTFVHAMAFRDAAAEKIHTSSGYVKTFVGALYPLCVTPPEFYDMKLVASKTAPTKSKLKG